ncbi:8385_t:CDS:2 [Cetraspora pellucida]|uniref:8385_t:CDS:1 n=1 Tax=Cetraspora pellucida TaxID=1433469 RepID=A0A9N9HBE5_9GLOM|nr:8385_t:CDS:2 [Cetraspora pellucida]
MQLIIKLNNIFCDKSKPIEYLIETNIIKIPEKCDHEIIEIDENKFEHFWIVGIIQHTKNIKNKAKINSIQKCYFEIVENRNTETIYRIIKKRIKKGSNVYTDSWKSYCDIEKYGIKHKQVNHSKKILNY